MYMSLFLDVRTKKILRFVFFWAVERVKER